VKFTSFKLYNFFKYNRCDNLLLVVDLLNFFEDKSQPRYLIIVKLPNKKNIKKALKIIGVFMLSLLAFLIIFPMLFPNYVADKIKQLANESLNGEVSFSDTNLSFFSHFPSLTLTLDDFLLKGSEPYKNDTLVAAKEIALGINVSSLVFGKTIDIDKIFVDNAFINVKVNENGGANYNVYVSDYEENTEDESSAKVKLKRIEITNTKLVYDDLSTDIFIQADGFNYLGKGDLDEAVFDLKTKARIESFDFRMGEEQYLKNKRVNAELITQINTGSLSFVFEQNNLRINRLPVDFKGKLDFLSNGYDIDFEVKSENSQLNDFFTALPPQYITWHEKTQMKGKTDLFFSLKGKYITSENLSPDMFFGMKIREGFVAYENAPEPARNIFMNFQTKLPALNPDQLEVRLDSLYFDLGKEYFSGIVNLKGLKTSEVGVKIRSKINLEKLSQTIQIPGLDLKGNFYADITSEGIYDTAQNLFPKTHGTLELTDAAIQTEYYPNPIKDINFKGKLLSTDGTMKTVSLEINPASLSFEDKPFELTASFRDFEDVNYDLQAKGELDLARIYKVFSQEGLDLEGYAKADISFRGKQSDATNGNYKALDNKGTLELRNIKTTSEYLPQAFIIKNGLFTFNQDRMNFSDFDAAYGKSDFLMNGYMENVINFALSDKEILKGNFSVTSDYLNVDEFLATVNENEIKTDTIAPVTSNAGVVVVPKTFDFNLNANFKKVDFQDLEIQNLRGNTQIKNGVLSLNNVGFGIIGSTATMSAKYQDETPNRAEFDFTIKAKNFDIKRAYNEVKLFREMASAAENAEGIISLDYSVGGKLDANMSPVYPSLEGGGTISIDKVKMKGFKMFNVVSKETSTDALKDPELSKIDIKTKIKNNIINIERFRFKVAGFRPRIEGQTSFDGKLNIKMRLGLPPLGIIGIPIKVTGTQDDPKVGVGKKTEDLDETEYDEDEIPNDSLPQIPMEVTNDSLAPLKMESLIVPEIQNDSIRE
jgi:AsmA protein